MIVPTSLLPFIFPFHLDELASAAAPWRLPSTCVFHLRIDAFCARRPPVGGDVCHERNRAGIDTGRRAGGVGFVIAGEGRSTRCSTPCQKRSSGWVSTHMTIVSCRASLPTRTIVEQLRVGPQSHRFTPVTNRWAPALARRRFVTWRCASVRRGALWMPCRAHSVKPC